MVYPSNITLNLNTRYVLPIPTAQQGDTARVLTFNILDNGVPFSLVGKSVRAKIIKPDGTKVFNDLTITNATNGECNLALTNQVLAVVGIVKCQLEITEGQDILSTIIFNIEVRESIDVTGAVESSNEFTALQNGLTKLDEWDKYFQETSGAIEEKYTTRLNAVESSLEKNVQEVNKVKTDYAKKTEVSELTKDKATVNYVNDSVARLSSGTPLFASSVSGMTDTTKNYVNTTDGFLYIYSDGSWIKTNVLYQSTGINDKSVSLNSTTFFKEIKNILYNKLNLTVGYINANNGQIVESINERTSDFIVLEQGKKYTGNFDYNGAFYNENEEYVSRLISTQSTQGKTTFQLPDGAKKVRFSFGTLELANKGMLVEGDVLPSVYQDYSTRNVTVEDEELNNTFKDLIKNENYFTETPTDNLINDLNSVQGHIGKDGNLISSTIEARTTEFIKVNEGFYYTTNADYSMGFYDANKNCIKADATFPPNTKNPHFITRGIKYIRLSYSANIKDSVVLIQGESINSTNFTTKNIENLKSLFANIYKLDNFNDVISNIILNVINEKPILSCFEGKIANFLGDSITYGYGLTDKDDNYTKTVNSLLGFSKLNNYGVSGSLISKHTSRSDSFLERYSSMVNNADLTVVYGGVNDYIASVPIGTFGGDNEYEFISAYELLIKGILQNNNTKHLICVTPFQVNGQGMYHIDWINKAGHKLIDYINAIYKVCEKYGVPVIDLYRESEINSLTYELYTQEGLHPNEVGAIKIGKKIAFGINNKC